MKRSDVLFGLFRIPLDFAAVFAALWAAYFLRAREDVLPVFFKRPDLGSFPSVPVYMEISLLVTVVLLILFAFSGLYRMRAGMPLAAEIRKIASASAVGLMAVITYYFFIRSFPFSRLVLFYAFGFLIVFVSAGRILLRFVRRFALRYGIGKRRIIFVGDNDITNELMFDFSRSQSAEILGTARNFLDFSAMLEEKKGVEEVIQTQDNHEEAEKIIDICRERHLAYHFVPDLLEVHRSNVEIFAVAGIPLISLKPTPLDGWGSVIKRIFDLAGALLGLVLFSPIFLLIAVAVKLDSRGPVFFRFLDDGTPAHRIGERGRRFGCLKFRTMKAGTHGMRYKELADRNLRKGTPMVKIQNDPRITRVGAFLRRFSLDELPQLWNVLAGQMSLVGPRPHLPEEVEKYERHHKFVLAIKPGITGLAQISGRSDLPFEEEVRLDTYYIENWSLWLDLKILVKTVVVVIKPYRE